MSPARGAAAASTAAAPPTPAAVPTLASGAPEPAPRLLAVRAWPLVQSLVGAAILVALAARLGAAPFIDGLRSVGFGSVLAALGIGMATTTFSALRWCLVARSLGLTLPARRAVAECYRALFLNSVLPAGVLGDVNRAVSHGRRVGDLRGSARAVVVERLAGQVVLVLVAAAVLIAHPTVLAAVCDLARTRRLPVAPASTAHGGTGVIKPTGVIGPVAIGPVVIVVVGLIVATGAVLVVRTRVRRRSRLHLTVWAAVGALSGAALLGYLSMFVIAARAAGSHAAMADLLPVSVLALLAMGLPLSVGGWGPREAVTTAVFAAVGLGAAQGLTVAVVYGALSFVACLPGAGVLLIGLIRPARETVTGDGVTAC